MLQVPADVRLLYCNDLKLETAALTGESEPIEYTAEPAVAYISVFDAHNVAFNGSLCHDGEALGMQIRTSRINNEMSVSSWEQQNIPIFNNQKITDFANLKYSLCNIQQLKLCYKFCRCRNPDGR